MGQQDSARGGRGKRRLGRGLSALVEPAAPVRVSPEHAPEPASTPAPPSAPPPPASQSVETDTRHNSGDASGALHHIELGLIRPSPYQPRQRMDESALRKLAESIERSGLMQPIVVRPRGAGYELVAGERRWRAAKLAGLDPIPALVREISDGAAAELALIENLQREDLNPVERARALQRLGTEFGLSQAEVGRRVGLERSTVANLVRLLDLGDAVLRMIEDGSLSIGHGKALLAVMDLKRRLRLAERAAAEGWSVRRLEREAGVGEARGGAERSGAAGAGDRGDTVRSALADLERRLGEHLGTAVTLRTNKDGKRGHMTLAFYDLDHFDGLMAKMGFRSDGL